MASRNRTAGHNFERECVKKLKKIGFTEAVTARSESRNLDNLGVDIANTHPYIIQCKNKVNNPNYHSIIEDMPQNIGIPIIFHRKTSKSNKGRFITKGEYTIIRMIDFLDLLEKVKKYENILKTI